MRRVALAIVSTATALAALLSFKTHSATSVAAAPAVVSTGPASASSGTDPSTSTPAVTPATTPSQAGSAAASSTAPTTTKTVTGDAADTRYGPVQVRITVTNGAVTNVTAIEYPENNPRDEQINAYAIPQLNSEATAAKSTKIDMVSGATYTSQGYLQSLQSALDKAGL